MGLIAPMLKITLDKGGFLVKKRYLKWIIPICLLIMLGVGSAIAYSQNKIMEQPQLSYTQPTPEQIETGKAIVAKMFQNDVQNLHLHPSPDFILESSTARFRIDSSRQMITGVEYVNVKPTGKTKNITETEAHQKAIGFIREHFPQIDLSKYQEEVGFDTNYVLVLHEIDREIGVKLLGTITVIINQETGEVAIASLDMVQPPPSTKITIDKATAQTIAENAVKNEFPGAKLVRSSDKPEVKIDGDVNKQRIGWIFIFESDKHSAGILVDGNTGETMIQRAY